MKNTRKLLYSITILSMCSTALTCNAHHTTDGRDNNFYVRFDAGISIPTNLNDKNDAYDFNSKKPGNSAIFNLGLGYIFNENFRSDVSLGLRNSYKYKSSFKDDDVESMNIEQKFKSTAIMLNGYYDIAHFSSFTPYVNLGLGYSRNNAADYKATVINVGETQSQNYIRAGKTSNNLAWNAGLGSLIHINDSISMDVSYKYSDLGKFSTTNIIRKNENRPESLAQPVSTKIRVHDITAGIIFKF